jgi:hypothetical protein
VTIAAAGSIVLAAAAPTQQPAVAAPQRPKGVVIRGCLAGSKLTQIDPLDVTLPLPGTLKVRSIRVIRGQVKALDGHTVEVIGTLRGIPGQETGVLVVDSDHGKLYLGGGDERLGQDLVPPSQEPPTIYAQMIKNVADTCSAHPPD